MEVPPFIPAFFFSERAATLHRPQTALNPSTLISLRYLSAGLKVDQSYKMTVGHHQNGETSVYRIGSWDGGSNNNVRQQLLGILTWPWHYKLGGWLTV